MTCREQDGTFGAVSTSSLSPTRASIWQKLCAARTGSQDDLRAESTIVAIPCRANAVPAARQGSNQRPWLGCVGRGHLRCCEDRVSTLADSATLAVSPKASSAGVAVVGSVCLRLRLLLLLLPSTIDIDAAAVNSPLLAFATRPSPALRHADTTRCESSAPYCSPCRLCWLRARRAPEGCQARASSPMGPLRQALRPLNQPSSSPAQDSTNASLAQVAGCTPLQTCIHSGTSSGR